jgi:hypothetical protein
MSQLLLQAPGSQNAGTGTWQDIRFSGRAVEQNVIKYDGVEGSAIIDAAPGNVNGENNTPFKLQASLENVQEFRVESSSYPAEYGTGTGGQISVITKSGANDFHGALFDYVRRDTFDARTTSTRRAARWQRHHHAAEVGAEEQDQIRRFDCGVRCARTRARSFFRQRTKAIARRGLNFRRSDSRASSAWARAAAAFAPLRSGFLAPGRRSVAGGRVGESGLRPSRSCRPTQQGDRRTPQRTRVDFKGDIDSGRSTCASSRQRHEQRAAGRHGRIFHTAANADQRGVSTCKGYSAPA